MCESSRLEFSDNVSANNFVLSDAKENTPGLLNRGETVALSLLRIDCFINISKLNIFKNPFTTITSLSELYCSCRRFILMVQTKYLVSVSCSSSLSSCKPWRWVKLDLIFTMRDICINIIFNPLKKFSSSRRSTEFKDLVHSTREYSKVSRRKFWVWKKINGNWDNNIFRISQWRESHGRASTKAKRKTLKPQKSRNDSQRVRQEWQSEMRAMLFCVNHWLLSFWKYLFKQVKSNIWAVFSKQCFFALSKNDF